MINYCLKLIAIGSNRIFSRSLTSFGHKKQNTIQNKLKLNTKEQFNKNNQQRKDTISSGMNQQQKKKGESQANKQFNWSKYGKDVEQVFACKDKDIQDFDIAFIAKKIELKEIKLTQQLAIKMKRFIKELKSVDFSLIPILLELSFQIGFVSPPQIFINSFMAYYKSNPFKTNKEIDLFPQYFTKKVGYNLIKLCSQRSFEEMTLALRHFGQQLSLNELKNIDEECSKNINSMSVDGVVRLLNIFRQIKKKGLFVTAAEQILIVKQKQISSKYLLTGVICLLQLQSTDKLVQLEEQLIYRVINAQFNDSEIITLMHILHKYKAGRKQLWIQFKKYSKNKHSKIPFQHVFAILSGLTRNHVSDSQNFAELIEHDPTLGYVQQLTNQQFVQFFYVLYFHYSTLPPNQKSKYNSLIREPLLGKDLKSIFLQIKYFFLYLFETNKNTKKQFLIKSYPDNILLALLSLAFPDIENADQTEKSQYETQLLTRYQLKDFNTNREAIVVEEFIRYKMVSVFKQDLLRD